MILQAKLFLALLIFEFWLSGLFVLSVIFLTVQDLDTLTLYTFSAFAVGSFLAGVLSDIIGRKPLFLICSFLLFASSVILNYSLWGGLIAANFCLGPLNNLTFLFLNENPQLSNEHNYIKVILGWVASEICLGLYFLLEGDQFLFLLMLCPLTGLYFLLSIFFTEETSSFSEKKKEFQERTWKSIFIPAEIKSLLGGSLLMFMMQMFYYRTQFTLDRFGVSLAINTIIVGSTEALANITFYRIVPKCKRKRTLFILLIALIILLMCLILIGNAVLQSIIEGVMRYCDSCIMLVLGFYLPELFTLQERGKGINYVMSFGVLGSALSGKIFSQIPLGYLQIFLGVAGLGLAALPQTMKGDSQSQLSDNLISDVL